MGKFMMMKKIDCDVLRLLERWRMKPYSFCQDSREIFSGALEDALFNLM